MRSDRVAETLRAAIEQSAILEGEGLPSDIVFSSSERSERP